MKSKFIRTAIPVAVVPLSFALGLAALMAPAYAVQNVQFTVNSTADSVDANPGDGVCMDANGKCTLRAAIMEANALAGPDTIVFDSSTDGVPIVLTLHGAGEDNDATGDLDITEDVTIQGDGTDKTIVDGDAADRVFDLHPTALSMTVEIDNLTVQNGNGVANGGGIQATNTTLVLNNDLIQNNQAQNSSGAAYGGGIYLESGNLTLDNTTLMNNTAYSTQDSHGGGIDGGGISGGFGYIEILGGSIISGNVAQAGSNTDASGGGIDTHQGDLTVDQSAIRDNEAEDLAAGGSAYGGGLEASGKYLITNSEISDNNVNSSETSFGGGVDTEYIPSDSALVNTTVTGNSAIANAADGYAAGGGVSLADEINGVTQTLANVTIAGNMVNAVSGGGGGLSIYSTVGTSTLRNSIVAGNQDASATAPDCFGASGGTITSGGYNLIGNGAGCSFTNASGDQVGTSGSPIDPKLGPLADNGGKTQTLALLLGSPAVDAGNPAGCLDASGNLLATDQRGSLRPTDGNGDGTMVCDIGAYERAADNPPNASDGSVTTNENTSVSGTLKATDPDGDTLTFAIASQPTHGIVTINDASTGTFTYTPTQGYSGSDAFSFTANDGYVDSNAATEKITVSAASSGGGSSGGGGGSFGPLVLTVLLFLALFYRRHLPLPAGLTFVQYKHAMKSFLYIVALALVGTLTAAPILAATLDLDTSFGNGGIVQTDYGLHQNDYGGATLVQPDGKLVVAGETCGASSNAPCEVTLVRYNSDGSLDTGFGNGGILLYDLGTGSNTASYASAVALLPDGKLLIAGGVYDPNTNNGEILLARFNVDGSLDTSFGNGGVIYLSESGMNVAYADGLAVAGDGSFYIAGQTAVSLSSGNQEYVAHVMADGTLDTSFGNNGFASAAVGGLTGNIENFAGPLLSTDGGIYVVGGYDDTSDAIHSFVLKYSADGTLDTTFGNGGSVTFDVGDVSENDNVENIATQADDKLVLSGDVTPRNGSGAYYYYVSRLNPDGTFDTSFAINGTYLSVAQPSFTYANSPLITPDGTIWVSGAFTDNNGQEVFFTQRFDSSGSPTAEYDLSASYFESSSEGVPLMQPDGMVVAPISLRATSTTDDDTGLVRFVGTSFTLTPAAFSFTYQSGVDRSATITSNMITVSGLSNGVSVPVSVSGGEYSINGGAWTTDPGFTQNGDQIAVRQTSSGSYSSKTTTTLTVGGYAVPNNPQIVLGSPVSADFASTTQAAPASSGGGGGLGPIALTALLLLVLFYRRHLPLPAGISFVQRKCTKKLQLAVINCTLLSLTLIAGPVLAAPGDIDTTFNGGVPVVYDGNPGIDVRNVATAVNPINADILWAGGASLNNGPAGGIIYAYKSNGALDTGVNGSGIITLTGAQVGFPGGDLAFYALAVDDQGRILASGYVSDSGGTTYDMLLARFKSDGTPDTTFGPAGTGIITAPLNAAAIGTGISLVADGHILVTGYADNDGNTATPLTVWRFNDNGTLDSSFGSDGDAQITDISDTGVLCYPALQPDGALIAGCNTVAGYWKLTRLMPDGTVDNTFGASGFVTGTGNISLFGLASAPDGGFVITIADMSSSPYPVGMRRFLANGSVDPGFNGGNPLALGSLPGPVNFMLPLAVQPDGKIVFGGDGGSNNLVIARLLSNGSFDSSFGSGGITSIPFSNIKGKTYDPGTTALCVQGDGKIVIAGFAGSSAGNNYAAFVTRLDNDVFSFTPAAFSFTDQTGVDVNATITSNMITVSGLSNDVSVPVSVTGGEYSINGGAWTTDPGFTQNGDQIAVRHTSSSSYSTTITTTLTVGGDAVPNNFLTLLGSPASADFSSTTEAAPPPPSGSSSGGGGGSFSPFALLGLLFLALVSLLLRRRHIRFDPIREDTPLKSHFFAIIFVTFMLGSIVTTTPALANPGDIDTTFNGGMPFLIHDVTGISITSYGAAINPLNGDILEAGYDSSNGGHGFITALKPDGTLDTGVDGGSIALTADQAGFPGGALVFYAAAVDNQGRILGAGFVEDSGGTTVEMVLARFNPNGTLDTSFGGTNTGIVLSAPNGFALASGLSLTADGDILVTGDAASNAADTQYELTVWRFLADGQIDGNFGGNGYVQISAIPNDNLEFCFPTLQPDGALIAGCTGTTGGGPWVIVRLNPDGSADSSFGTNGSIAGPANYLLKDLALSPDDGLVIDEQDQTSSELYLRRYLDSGSIDISFNGGSALAVGIPGGPVPIAVQPNGRILVSFNGTAGGGGSDLAIVRLLADGTFDNSFGTNGIAAIDFSNFDGDDYVPSPWTLLIQGDGRILATGYAESSTSNDYASIATRVLSDSYELDPDSPTFSNQTRAPLGEAVASNAVYVTGVNIGGSSNDVHVALATQNGKYSTTGASGPFAGDFSGFNAAWASAGDSLALEQMTPTTGGMDTTTNVVLGGFWAPNNYEIPLGNPAVTSWKTTTDEPPVASDESLTATSGVVVSGTLSATNPSGSTLSFAIVSPPSHGTATITNATTGAYTYTSTSGYIGSDSFTWKTYDGVADSNTASVTIAVKTTSGSGGSTGSSGGGGGFGVLALLALLLCAGALRWRKQSGRSTYWKSVTSTGRLVAAITLSLLALPVLAAAQWQQVSQGVWLNDVSYGAGRYVATGYTGIYTSTDGFSWQQAILPAEATPDFHRILWNPTQGRYVTGGYSGAVLTSPDGLTWTLHTTGLGTLFDIVFANGQYVAVSDDGSRVATSSDGVNWTVHDTPASQNDILNGVAWNGTLYVAAGSCRFQSCPDGTDVVLTSPDGINWTLADPGTGNDPIYADGIAWGNGAFVVVGENGVITSTNGTNWTRQALNSNYLFSAANNNALRFEGGQFIGVGIDFTPGQRTPTVFTSNDGTSWNAGHVPDPYTPGFATSAELIAGTVYVTSSDGSIFGSSDLANWSTNRSGSTLGDDVYSASAYGNGRYLTYISPDPVSSAYVSLDGIDWTQQGTNAALCYSMAYGAGQFVCSTLLAGTLYTSPDENSWVARTNGIEPNTFINDVVNSSDGFIAVGYDPTGGNTTSAVLSSHDGINWAAQPSASVANVYLNQVVADINGYYALGDSTDSGGESQTPHLLFSADASNWAELSPDWPGDFEPTALTAQGQTLIAVGINFRGLVRCPAGGCQTEVFTSSDGIHWTQQDVSGLGVPNGTNWQGGTWGGGLFELYGNAGDTDNLVFLSSHDALVWQYSALPGTAVDGGSPYSILWSGNQFVTAVGTGGIFRLAGIHLNLSLRAPAQVRAGKRFHYRVRVRNTDPSADATDVIVSDTLPAGVQFLSAHIRHSSGSCTASGQNVVCTLSEPLDAGARATIRIRVRAPRTSGTLDDHASIIADQPYTDGSTASANAATVVVCHRHCSP